MSVLSLANTLVNVYGVVTSQDSYGANVESYYLKYSGLKVRIRLLKATYETFIDGKEMSPNTYRFYFPSQLTILTSDLIVDTRKNRKYDILYVNRMDRKKHMQVDAKRIDAIINNIIYLSSSSSSSSSGYQSTSSSSSDNICPNNIHSWNGSVFLV